MNFVYEFLYVLSLSKRTQLALIDYSAKHFGLEGFMAVVTEGNIGSEKVLAKSGFTLHRIVPDAYEIGGQRYADHIYIMGRIVT
nr:GNAT family N-acetyltransferase [Vibrio cholerae]